MDVHQPFVVSKAAISGVDGKVIMKEAVTIQLFHVVFPHTLSHSKPVFTNFL